jgi:IclR family KDG regulon transcriptional repressor
LIPTATPSFKRVPAVDKCFAVLEVLAQSNEPMGISELSRRLNLNKSTVFNLVHTLIDLNVLESQPDGKFALGMRFYTLRNMTGKRSALIQVAHPFLQTLNEQTKLSAFLGLRSDVHAILVDKVDSAYGIKVSSEIGMRMPSLAGAGIKAMLSQLPDREIDEILIRTKLTRYTPHSVVNKAAYRRQILEVRKEGIAYDREEYIEGMIAFAVPVQANNRHLQAAVWTVGLTSQVPESSLVELTELMKGISREISCRLQ